MHAIENRMDIRLDKWLWAVRCFKTRPLATEACRAGKVCIDGHECKPSRTVQIGAIIHAKVGLLNRTLKVVQLTDKRVPAKDAECFAMDLTPPEEIERVRMIQTAPTFKPPPGLGRPTKKQRRSIERVMLGLSSPDWKD